MPSARPDLNPVRSARSHFVLQIVLQMTISFLMKTTLSIRLPSAQREALKRRATAEKKSESALVRELIDREMAREFDFEQVRHLVGGVASSSKHRKGDSWRQKIRERNWR